MTNNFIPKFAQTLVTIKFRILTTCQQKDVRIALEFKPKEPRNFCYLARSADTLLMALDANRENVGVTIDTGHAMAAGEYVAEAAFRLMQRGKLFHLHFNDNYRSWDDDMIVVEYKY